MRIVFYVLTGVLAFANLTLWGVASAYAWHAFERVEPLGNVATVTITLFAIFLTVALPIWILARKFHDGRAWLWAAIWTVQIGALLFLAWLFVPVGPAGYDRWMIDG